MATHGTERDAQRRYDFIRTELMTQGERILDIEQRLRDLQRSLDAFERSVGGSGGPVGSASTAMFT